MASMAMASRPKTAPRTPVPKMASNTRSHFSKDSSDASLISRKS